MEDFKGMTVKEYALDRGLSINSVHMKIATYRDELGDNVRKINRIWIINEKAAEIMDSHINKRLFPDTLNKRLNKSEQENDQLRKEIEALQGQIGKLKEEKEALQRKIWDQQSQINDFKRKKL